MRPPLPMLNLGQIPGFRKAVWGTTIYGERGAERKLRGKVMSIQDAKAVVGSQLKIYWTGRKGDEISEIVHVLNVGFVPFYGPCLITDIGEISLDRVVDYDCMVPEQKAS